MSVMLKLYVLEYLDLYVYVMVSVLVGLVFGGENVYMFCAEESSVS